MISLYETLEKKVKEINEKKSDEMKKWIEKDPGPGKIVELEAENKCFHLVFTSEGVKLREGGYPSCEVYYKGSEENLKKIINGKLGAYVGAKKGKLKTWGNLNEANNFEALL